MTKINLVLIAINIVILVAIYIIFIRKGGLKMLILTIDNPVVCAWYTAVKLYGYTIEQVPANWGLRDLVQEKLDEDAKKEK